MHPWLCFPSQWRCNFQQNYPLKCLKKHACDACFCGFLCFFCSLDGIHALVKCSESRHDVNKVNIGFLRKSHFDTHFIGKHSFSRKNLWDIRFSYLDYEKYYFNGIPFPKDIKAEKKENKLLISWNIDDSMTNDIDIKNIKYMIYINDNGYDLNYESINKYFYYNNYDEKTINEIKVRTLIDNYYSDWTEIKRIHI